MWDLTSAKPVNNPIQTAVRRKIIVNQDGELSLLHRNIGWYSLDHLIDMLLAAMGTGWWEREDALVAAARHLGYRRTAHNIRTAFKSAIKAAIRRGRLETSRPNRIRRL